MAKLVAVLVIFLPCFINGEYLKCIYGDQPICGSDGVTYLNRCDLEIVRTVHPYLNMIHVGRCRDGIETIKRVFNIFEYGNNALRRSRKSKGKYGPLKPNFPNLFRLDLKQHLLSQYYNSIMTLSAFNMRNNSISTSGDNNVFQISFASD